MSCYVTTGLRRDDHLDQMSPDPLPEGPGPQNPDTQNQTEQSVSSWVCLVSVNVLVLRAVTVCHMINLSMAEDPDSVSPAVSRVVCVSDGEQTACERQRAAALASTPSSFRPRPAVGQYVPSCDGYGAYEPLQCHAGLGQCWCVDASGQEIPGSRTEPGRRPMCKNMHRMHIMTVFTWL